MSTIRTIELPTNPAGSWDGFQYPSKAPGDDLDYGIDGAKWLKDAGLTLVFATVRQSGGLVVGPPVCSTTGVTLRISGGLPGDTPTLSVRLFLSNGRELDVVVALPVRADTGAAAVQPVADPALDAILTVDGEPVTFGGVLIPI